MIIKYTTKWWLNQLEKKQLLHASVLKNIYVYMYLPDDDEVSEVEDESRDGPNRGSHASKSLVPFLS